MLNVSKTLTTTSRIKLIFRVSDSKEAPHSQYLMIRNFVSVYKPLKINVVTAETIQIRERAKNSWNTLETKW